MGTSCGIITDKFLSVKKGKLTENLVVHNPVGEKVTESGIVNSLSEPCGQTLVCLTLIFQHGMIIVNILAL